MKGRGRRAQGKGVNDLKGREGKRRGRKGKERKRKCRQRLIVLIGIKDKGRTVYEEKV